MEQKRYIYRWPRVPCRVSKGSALEFGWCERHVSVGFDSDEDFV
jgi:hypothetical protein